MFFPEPSQVYVKMICGLANVTDYAAILSQSYSFCCRSLSIHQAGCLVDSCPGVPLGSGVLVCRLKRLAFLREKAMISIRCFIGPWHIMSFDFARGRPPSVSMERSIYVARSLYRSLAEFWASWVWMCGLNAVLTMTP